MVESTEQVSGFTFRSEEFRVIGLRPTLLCFPAAALRPAVTVGRARYSPGSPPAAPPPRSGRIARVCSRSRRARAEKPWSSLSTPWRELPLGNFRASCSCKTEAETRTGSTSPVNQNGSAAPNADVLFCWGDKKLWPVDVVPTPGAL